MAAKKKAPKRIVRRVRRPRRTFLAPIYSHETHKGDVSISIGEEEVIVSRRVAFLFATEIMLACNGVGFKDVARYFTERAAKA